MRDQKQALSAVGEITVLWNRIEEDFSSLVGLYIDAERKTVDILLEDRRSIDREKLLRNLIKHREPVENVKNEIREALRHIARLRENRNIVTHQIGRTRDSISESGLEQLHVFRDHIPRFHEYLKSLIFQINVLIQDREARSIYGDDVSANDEEVPIPEFQSPIRPVMIKKFNAEDIA